MYSKHDSLIHSKSKPVLHTEEWNSRFWVEKIPNYDSKSPLKLCQEKQGKPQDCLILPNIKPAPCVRLASIPKNPTKNISAAKLRIKLSIPQPSSTKSSIKKTINKKNVEQQASAIELSQNKLIEPLKKNLTVSGLKKCSQKAFIHLKSAQILKETKNSKKNSQKPKVFEKSKSGYDSSSELEDEFNIINIQFFSNSLAEDLLQEFASTFCEFVVDETCKDMVSASLILFSNILLEKYLKEVLSIEIPLISEKTYKEVKEIEYIDIRNDIISDIIEEDLQRIIFDLTNTKISQNLIPEYLSMLNFDDIINEALRDEKSITKSIINSIVQDTIELFLKEDWVEILVEDEITITKLQSIWTKFNIPDKNIL